MVDFANIIADKKILEEILVFLGCECKILPQNPAWIHRIEFHHREKRYPRIMRGITSECRDGMFLLGYYNYKKTDGLFQILSESREILPQNSKRNYSRTVSRILPKSSDEFPQNLARDSPRMLREADYLKVMRGIYSDSGKLLSHNPERASRRMLREITVEY